MIVYFLIAALANYRISRMIANERGPFDVFHHLRRLVYKTWPDKDFMGPSDYSPTSWQFDGITCIDCLSFWLAWIFSFVIPFDGWVMYAVNALAISAASVILNHSSFLK